MHWYAQTGLARRRFLRTLGCAGGAMFVGASRGDELARTPGIAVQPVGAYLDQFRQPDHGYAWHPQTGSHLTPTFAAIGALRLLKLRPPQPDLTAEFVRSHHPSRLKKLEQEHHEFELQQIQALLWLGADASDFAGLVRRWREPAVYLKQYESHGYPVFRFEMAAIRCRALLGLPLDDLSPAFTLYLDARRRENGSFNNTPASDGGDGHVLNTLWGLQALHDFGRAREKVSVTVDWLRACQLPSGGFTWQPQAPFAAWEDVAYTWAAVRSLHLLGSSPAESARCVEWLLSLAQTDGGFGDRPGWAANPMATYYALDALTALGALPHRPPQKRGVTATARSLAPGLKVFSAQIEAHGSGSPTEAVQLARALRIHLWGAKNARAGWIETAQRLATAGGVPVSFFVSNEEYGTWVDVPGLGTYSHTSDVIAPASTDPGESLARAGVATWPDFRRKRLAPLEAAGGRLIWQFGENEELVRLFLDDSLIRGGYAAISTFHFGNPDFTNSEPFLHRYRGRIPFVALQDAHGTEPWWFADMTTGFRTLFLATEPSWSNWLESLRRNWVVAARHDALNGYSTWLHGGSDEVIEFVRANEGDWRWWDNPAIQRPMVSLVALRPGDILEAGHPARGVTLRVRCAWENTAQGQPKSPLSELVRLTLDGAALEPKLVTVPRPRGAGYADYRHECHLPDLPPGKHSATAVVRSIPRGLETAQTIQFEGA